MDITRDVGFLLRAPVAHRGFHGEGAPENSLAAFRRAIERGYGIETDVRFTRDGRLVVFHDDTLRRMTGDARAVADCSYDEIAALRLADTDERVPLFTEFLDEADGRVPLLIEIKNMKGVKGARVADAMNFFLKDYSGDYAVQSFDPTYVKAYKKLRPDVPCGLLSTADPALADFPKPFARIKRHIVKHMSLNFWLKPDFLSYRFTDFPNRKAEKFKKPKLAWPVGSPEQEAYARQYADNVIFEGYEAEGGVPHRRGTD